MINGEFNFNATSGRSFVTGSELNAAFKRVAGRRMLILDTCFSGAAGASSNPYALTKRSASSQIAVFSAASGAEESYESADQPHGAFTYALSQALGGAGDFDKVSGGDARRSFAVCGATGLLRISRNCYNARPSQVRHPAKATQTPTLTAQFGAEAGSSGGLLIAGCRIRLPGAEPWTTWHVASVFACEVKTDRAE